MAARALAAQKRGAAMPADGEGGGKRAKGDVLSDPRFAAMFEQRDFEIDPDSEEYKQLHPNAGDCRPLTVPQHTHSACI